MQVVIRLIRRTSCEVEDDKPVAINKIKRDSMGITYSIAPIGLEVR